MALLNVRMIRHRDYLEFAVTGAHDLGEALSAFPRVLAACRDTGLQKVLVDYRELNYDEVGGTEKVLYAFGAEGEYLKYLHSGGHELQMAYVAPIVSSFEPGADVGRAIPSLRFELIESVDEALKWLDVGDR